ncbi:hypothetical protein VTO73DRAFT_9003 [Trametes versicolor]
MPLARSRRKGDSEANTSVYFTPRYNTALARQQHARQLVSVKKSMSIKSPPSSYNSKHPAHNLNPAPITTPTSATPAPTSPPIPPTLTRPIALAALLVWLAPALLTPLVLLIAVALLKRLDTLLAPAEAALESELKTLESAEVAEDWADDALEAMLVAMLGELRVTQELRVEVPQHKTRHVPCIVTPRPRSQYKLSSTHSTYKHDLDAHWASVPVNRNIATSGAFLTRDRGARAVVLPVVDIVLLGTLDALLVQGAV